MFLATSQAAYEHAILQDIALVVTIATLMAAGFYAWLRKLSPTPPIPVGNVSTSYYSPVDLVGSLLVSAPFILSLIFRPAEAPDQLPTIALVINFTIVLGMAGVTLLIFKTRDLLPHAMDLKPKHPAQVVAWAVGAYIVMFMLVIAMGQSGIEGWFQERLGERQNQDVVNQLIYSKNEQRLILILGACVIAPFAEEIVFRGYLYPVVKKYTDPVVAILFTGVIFGAIHGEIWAVLLLSIFGILLAILYELSGSIWACIICHVLFNTINVFFMLTMGDKL